MNKPDALVFFDLDGTLLNSKSDVSDSTIECLQRLKENNIKPILATGRALCEIEDIMHKSGLDSIIGMNGQSILFEHQALYGNHIDPDAIDALRQAAKSHDNIPLVFLNDHKMALSEMTPAITQLFNYLNQTIPPLEPEIYKHEPVQMILLACESGEAHFKEQFPNLTFVRNNPYCVDVMNQGGSKASGIQKLIELNGYQGIPTYAFGDGMNDIEMFQYVDHPIAMENSCVEIKASAEFITADNDHDGILLGLKKYQLI